MLPSKYKVANPESLRQQYRRGADGLHRRERGGCGRGDGGRAEGLEERTRGGQRRENLARGCVMRFV